jgi:hypothetical protein
VIEIGFDHPDDGQPVVLGTSKESGSFTVGRSPDCSIVLTQGELSRCAMTIAEAEHDQVRITGGQRYGYVQVTRSDGVRKATLAAGEEVVCGGGTYRIVLRTSTADVLSLELRVTVRMRNELPGVQTVGRWSRPQIFEPTREDDVRWFAALAAVIAHTPARRKGDALAMVARAWCGGDWSASVPRKLDKVRKHLGLADTGANKQDEIASWVHATGVIASAEFAAFTDEVKKRAADNLSRAEMGHLGWGRYARERQK